MKRLLKRVVYFLVVGLWMGWVIVGLPQMSAASIHVYPEGSDQVMQRSLQTLRDQSGQAWQMVLYQRVQGTQVKSLNLRLVGFPGVAEFDHPQPLTLDMGLGDRWTAANVTPTDFSPNVGEYDMRSIMAQLDSNAPLHLLLPLKQGETKMVIPPFAVREWRQLQRQNFP